MKVMIVDDEVIIRNGLSKVIHWEENGFTVLEPAASAEEALQRIPDERPEIIFTDIRMTGLSGIDMAREVKKRFPDTEIIIISGFDEFAYAQQAMREGISDYLLKTSRPGEIIHSAAKARERLELRRRNEAGGRAQQTIVNRGFLRRLLASGAVPDAQAEAEFWDRFPDLRLDPDGLSVLRIWLLSVHSFGRGERVGRLDGDVYSIIGSRLSERMATQAKLRKAMVLLRETPAKVSEVASEIGYEDLKYFTRLFKKFTGLTPSEYRASPEVCPSPD